MDLAVVYPVYNEVDVLEDTADKTVDFLKTTEVEEFTVIFVTDGSTDGTQKEADRLEKKIPEVQHLEYDERLGKGAAFEEAFKQSDAEKFAYCDADLSTDLQHLEEAVEYLDGGYSIAVGSRRIEKGLDRGIRRELPSILFNELVKLSLGSNIEDHQCGFKAFNSEEVKSLFEEIESNHWFWDAEMLVRAQKNDLNIKEFPVNWNESSDSKVNVLKDSLYFLKKTGELRINLWR